MPDGYIWCEHCGYNRSLTTDQLKELNDDVVETWCQECDEAMLNHGSECPDHIHLDLPLLSYQDDEPLKITPEDSDRLDRWRAQGVEKKPPCQYCKGTGWLVLPAMKGAVPCDHGKDASSWICADAGMPTNSETSIEMPCPRCGRCGFIEDADMNLAGECPECKGTGRALIRHNAGVLAHADEKTL